MESVAGFAFRLGRITVDINSRHDVDGLCKEFPDRVAQVIEAEGDRISKYSAHLKTKYKGKAKSNLSPLS